MKEYIKQWFQFALLQADITYQSFGATLQPPVSRAMISRVLAGKTTSPRVEKAILDFTRQKLPVLHARLDNLRDNKHPLYVESLSA